MTIFSIFIFVLIYLFCTNYNLNRLYSDRKKKVIIFFVALIVADVGAILFYILNGWNNIVGEQILYVLVFWGMKNIYKTDYEYKLELKRRGNPQIKNLRKKFNIIIIIWFLLPGICFEVYSIINKVTSVYIPNKLMDLALLGFVLYICGIFTIAGIACKKIKPYATEVEEDFKKEYFKNTEATE